MGLFDKFKRNTEINFDEIDSNDKAITLVNERVLKPLYLIPPEFGGAESQMNVIFVPKDAFNEKNLVDDKVQDMIFEGKVDGYSCIPTTRESASLRRSS